MHWSGGRWESLFDLMPCWLWYDFTDFKQCLCDWASVTDSNAVSSMFWKLENLHSECGDLDIGWKKNGNNTMLYSWEHLERFFQNYCLFFAARLENYFLTACKKRNHYCEEYIIYEWTSYQGKYFCLLKQWGFFPLPYKKELSFLGEKVWRTGGNWFVTWAISIV